MKYGKRLKIAREHKKLSQQGLSDICGVGQGSISKIERGDQDTSAHDIELSYTLEVHPLWLKNGDKRFTPRWLITDDEYIESEVIKKELIHTSTDVPLISWVSAGKWCEAIDNYSKGDAEAWLPCPQRHGKYTYALRVSGDSMTSNHAGSKSYPDGSIIYIDPELQVVNGCRVIAKLIDVNEVTFKQYKEDAGKKWLIPINSQYDKILIDENIVICGVVIAKYEPE